MELGGFVNHNGGESGCAQSKIAILHQLWYACEL